MRLGWAVIRHRAAGAIALAGGVACAVLASPPASAAGCVLPGPAAAVAVRVDEGRVAIDNSHDGQQLTELRRRTGGNSGLGESAGWRSAGLTVSNTGYRLSVDVTAVRHGKERVCARLTGAELDLGLHRLDVYVARKYPPGSCAYDTVLAHEYQHVAIFGGELKRHLPSMQRRLTASAARLAPVVAASLEAAATYFQRSLQSELETVFRQMNQAADHANRRLDTAQNYRLEQGRCSNW